MRRLQDEIPDFAFDAWIAPLTVKIDRDRVLLGCPTSFHRDRVRREYGDLIRRCCDAARASEPDGTSSCAVDVLARKEFEAAAGQRLEARTAEPRAVREAELSELRTVQAAAAARNAGQASTAGTRNPGQASTAGTRNAGQPSTAGTRTASPIAAASVAADLAPLRAVPSGRRAARPSSGSNERRHPMQPAKQPARVRNDARRARDRVEQTAPESGLEPGLDGRPVQPELPFSFESFVVGPCNALAREAALALARRRQQSLNQLYLGGEAGMGKTHLARATAAEARRFARAGRPTPPSGIVYTSAEQFTSEFVSAMRNGRSEQWQKRYRGRIDLLVVEDVQFFSGRAKTQLELFHTVQHVLDAGGRVLLTGDRSPRDLQGLDERMRAQVGRGFVAELERPDALVRRHILRAKAAAGGVHLPEDCLELLVESTEGSVRDVESVLIQVVTTASLLGRGIDLALTQDAIALKSGAESAIARPRQVDISEIVRLVAAFFGKRPEVLASRSRRRDVLVPRQLAMYLAHRYTDASLTEIGRGLGRDHPAVRNAITRVERGVLENAPLRYQVEALSERIDQRLADPDAGATAAGGRAPLDPGHEAKNGETTLDSGAKTKNGRGA